MRSASALLRVVLMISLLLNGLNVAVAGHHVAGARAAPMAAQTMPPCHDHERMPGSAAHPGERAHPQSDDGDGHCRALDCLRACAQQPALPLSTMAPLPAPWFSLKPAVTVDRDRPAPALSRIQRPPIG